MKLILHIGPPKTGSSYIQENLKHRQDELSRLGVNYPTSGHAASPKHLALTGALIRGRLNEAEPMIKEIVAGGAHTAILSDEGMSALEPDTIKWLASFFDEVRAVYYFRPWPKRLPSDYQQRIKGGKTHTFPDFLIPALLRPWRSPYTNPGVTLEKFERALGLDAVMAVNFDEAAREELFRHFLTKIVGLSVDLPPVDRGLNASLTPVTVEIVRFWNLASRNLADKNGPIVLQRFLQAVESHGTQDLAEMLQPYMQELNLRDDLPPFRDIHASLSQYGLAVGKTQSVAHYVNADYLVQPKIVDEMRRIVGVVV